VTQIPNELPLFFSTVPYKFLVPFKLHYCSEML